MQINKLKIILFKFDYSSDKTNSIQQKNTIFKTLKVICLCRTYYRYRCIKKMCQSINARKM